MERTINDDLLVRLVQLLTQCKDIAGLLTPTGDNMAMYTIIGTTLAMARSHLNDASYKVLVRDNDSHWYLIPATKKQEWVELTKQYENIPDYAMIVDNISDIEFLL